MKGRALIFVLHLAWISAGVTSSAFAETDSVGNGGGLSEQNVSFAYLNLAIAYDSCLEFPECLPDAESHELLQKLKASLPQEYQNKAQLQFESGLQAPGLFLVRGKTQKAVTGKEVGDPIWINLDLIYPLDTSKNQRPLQIHEAMAILVSQMAQHHSSRAIEDEFYREYVGEEIARSFLKAGLGN